MRRSLGDLLGSLASHLNLVEEDDVTGETPGIVAAIERAKNEWHSACSYFNSVTDTELIDHAIFSIEAAERKYVYLLRKAKEMGIKTGTEPLRLPDGGTLTGYSNPSPKELQ